MTALIAPIGLLVYLRLQPGADSVRKEPLFHFYIVTFTAFTAVVISLLLTSAMGEKAKPRHLLVSSAFGLMGLVFFSHGVATPNALINFSHPAVQWSAWLTLLLSGVIFSIASFDTPAGFPSWLPIRKILTFIILFTIFYLGIALFAHTWLDQIGSQASPWHRVTLFLLTMLLWLFATVRFALIWIQTQNRVDATMTFVSLWLLFATVSMHNFATWTLSWWMYHFLMLISFLVTMIVLIREYEQTRRFQLTRYYLAVSLIFTAFSALFASSLFANYSFSAMSERIQTDARTGIAALTGTIQSGLSSISVQDSLREYAQRLKNQPLGETLLIFTADGKYYYPFTDEYREPTTIPADLLDDFTRAMDGEIFTSILPPETPPAGYEPAEDTFTLLTFAPLYNALDAEPVGVVQIIRAIPEVSTTILAARATGLTITTVTMGVLFLALLLVIRRADVILTARTRELENAYTDLRRAENLREDMTSMIVHDLRNPITSISASLELLEKQTPPEPDTPSSRFTKIAKNAARKTLHLVDDILTVSKFESGTLQLNRERASFAQIIGQVIEGFQGQSEAEEKQIKFVGSVSLTAVLDKALIARVLDNLISNALKYTDEGTGQIEICTRQENQKIYVSVKDNGEGIPDEYKIFIFDKFKQAPTNNQNPRKGTGLGLTFCQMVIETHGGEIWVEDADGGGSEFIFWLPG